LHFTPRLRWVIDSAHVGEHLAEISYCTPICPQPPPLFTRLPTRTHKHKHKHKHATVLPASSALLLTLCRPAFTEGLTWEVMYSLILDANDANAELTYSLSLSLFVSLSHSNRRIYIFFVYVYMCSDFECVPISESTPVQYLCRCFLCRVPCTSAFRTEDSPCDRLCDRPLITPPPQGLLHSWQHDRPYVPERPHHPPACRESSLRPDLRKEDPCTSLSLSFFHR
jgi:hypothetical protein